MDKKGNALPWVLLAVAALILFFPNIQTMLGGGTTTTPTTPTTGGASTGAGLICPVDVTTLGFSPKDFNDPGNVVYVNARLWLDSNPQGVINTSVTNLEASPDDKIELWFGAGDSTYYGSHFNTDEKVPCKGTYTVPGTLWVKDNAVTMKVYDSDDNLQPGDGSAYNQTLGIGEEKTLKLRVQGNYQKYYGNPEVKLDNVFVAEYAKTELKKVALLSKGVEQATAAVPIIHELDDVANSAVGFLMPKISGSDAVDYQVLVRADPIVNPSSEVVLTIYDADYFYNTKTGKIDSGYADENNADIGATTEPAVTLYIE